MSYDLAVWEGPKPPDDAQAALEYERRMDAMERAFDGTEAAPLLVAHADTGLHAERHSRTPKGPSDISAPGQP